MRLEVDPKDAEEQSIIDRGRDLSRMAGGGTKPNILTGFTVAPDLKTAQCALPSCRRTFYFSMQGGDVFAMCFLYMWRSHVHVPAACRTRFGTRNVKDMDIGVEALLLRAIVVGGIGFKLSCRRVPYTLNLARDLHFVFLCYRLQTVCRCSSCLHRVQSAE